MEYPDKPTDVELEEERLKEINDRNDLNKVIEYAKELHKNQKRKYTGDPYFVHLEAVAYMVDAYNKHRYPYPNPKMHYAAYLHDSLEDTDVTHEELRVWLHSNIDREIADGVLRLVVELTDVYTKENFPELNRKQRKKLEAERMGRCIHYGARVIKLCDMLDNTKSIFTHDEKFADVFLEEKDYLIKCMEFEGKEQKILEAYFREKDSI